LATLALYQGEHAALAIKAAFLLGDGRLMEEAVYAGVSAMVWPGRMEEITPGLIVDGAHNEDGIRAFLESVEALPCHGRRYLLFGAVRERPSLAMMKLLEGSKCFHEIVACPLENPRSLTPSELKELVGRTQVCSNAALGLKYLRGRKRDEDLIFVAGSLYLVAEVMRIEDYAKL
jgi:dihydrofolate synthase/folylpolyglutamate synthase